MVNRITPERILETNRHMIYEHIYRGRDTSLQKISEALNMSRPTVTNHLSVMEKEGLIVRKGLIPPKHEAQGRRAVEWAVDEKYKLAAGVEILRHIIKIIAIDLYGKPVKSMKLHVEYKNSEDYYRDICGHIKRFIKSLELSEENRILGIGFAVQGLVSEDGSTVIYGEILKCTGLKIDVFTRWLDYPCRFIHEPDGAALSELWVSPELDSAMYLSMSDHLGGAVISNRKIINGIHRHAATFEHIQALQEGRLCYCGKRGCYETVCSKDALLGDEEPESFFADLREGKNDNVERWGVFLKFLGRLIAQLHLVVDTKYVLGGHLAPFFTDDDIKTLYHEVRELTPFVENDDFLLISKMPSHNITIGAALPYIMSFLESAGGKSLTSARL